MPEGLWRAPIMREEEENERRVTWIELFIDLAFVALVAAIASNLALKVDLLTVAEAALLFTSMWVVWRFAAIYADRFETDDLSYRLALLGIMAAVVIMAASVGEGFVRGFRGFAVGYVAADAIVMTLWQRGARHNKRFRPLADRLTIAHAAAIAAWLLAIAVGAPLGWWLALVGVGFDFSVPLLTTRQQQALPRLSGSHLPERFGQFTIIVLGEGVIALIAGLSALPQRTAATWVAGACVLLLFTGIYWMYFDQIMWDQPPEHPLRRNITQYLHLPLMMAIALMSAFSPEFLARPGSPFSLSSRLLFSAGIALTLVSVAVLDTMLATQPLRACVLGRSRRTQFIGAALMVLLGVLGSRLPAILLVAAADLAVFVVIVVSVRRLGENAAC